MKQTDLNGKQAEGQYRQGFDDSFIIAYLTLVQVQPIVRMPLIFLVKNRGNCPPGYPQSPGTGYSLGTDVQPVVTKWSIIKN
ncbi:MAG: hypothetical protein WCL21_10895 [Mariniphaga sp.]